MGCNGIRVGQEPLGQDIEMGYKKLDMGHQDWTGATERGHMRGQEPPSHHPAPFICYSHQENCAHSNLCRDTPRHML